VAAAAKRVTFLALPADGARELGSGLGSVQSGARIEQETGAVRRSAPALGDRARTPC
jgi:hypothetical protein